jgi:hypothetical protein
MDEEIIDPSSPVSHKLLVVELSGRMLEARVK